LIAPDSIRPVDRVVVWKDEDAANKERIVNIGMEAIRAGQIAAVIMSGGQGTRLGFSGPKGMYDMGLPSKSSIFQIHIHRILKLRQLASSNGHSACIPVYIMTSDLNDRDIRNFFEENNYFGYPKEDIFFFEQSLQPCMDFSGKVIIESKTSLALAPDGNGGLYHALKASGAMEDITRRNVKYLHVYGIDNVLTKSVDPAFMGLCIDQGAECGNKVVWRANKNEKVGVTANTGDRMCIIEYSEIPKALAEAVDGNGKLVFGAANICNHFINVEFLANAVLPSLSGSYHLANKKIPFYDPESDTQVTPSSNNGVKLEMFIFDIFPLASKWTVMEIERQDEFAPVKNAPGDPADSPDTARAMMSAQGIQWLRSAGATVELLNSSADNICEIAPLISYGGEGLEEYQGQVVRLPFVRA
jgi:UDP-N-acetylglucosamine/UDP-N-acetylgalactosamine diphosphorylase